MKSNVTNESSQPHTQQAVVQKPETKSNKLLWVAVGIIILATVISIGVWLANTLIKVPTQL